MARPTDLTLARLAVLKALDGWHRSTNHNLDALENQRVLVSGSLAVQVFAELSIGASTTVAKATRWKDFALLLVSSASTVQLDRAIRHYNEHTRLGKESPDKIKHAVSSDKAGEIKERLDRGERQQPAQIRLMAQPKKRTQPRISCAWANGGTVEVRTNERRCSK